MSLLQMSLSGGCIILTAILLRALALHRLPKNVFQAMWGIAAARMLLPVELPSRWSAFALFVNNSQARVGERMVAMNAAESAAAQTIPLRTASGVNWLSVLWLAGALACGAVFLLAWMRSLRRFREAVPVHEDEVSRFLGAHPLRRRVTVKRSDRISAPLTYGLLRPVILLPKRALPDGDTLELILCHEWTHIRSLDVLKKALLAAAACVHWFNPLAWAMLSLANRDIELACDEQVLRMHGDRRAYAMALIAMEEARQPAEPLLSHFSKNTTEERISAIMKTRKKSLLSSVLAVLLALCATVAFATSAPGDGDNPYAQYKPYGLTYNADENRLYFNGRLVRYFEDMYPVGQYGDCAGTVVSHSDGEVDVHAVRDLTGDIVRSEDGSFDPSGVLTGVEAYSQEEFDARTEEMEKGDALYYAGGLAYSSGQAVTVIGADGEVEYMQSVPEEVSDDVYAIETAESDGPTSVYVGSEDGGYSYSVNEEVTVIGGADGPTSIYVASGAETADDGRLSMEVFAEYAAFGLSVENNALYFEGQRVRTFTDTYKEGFFRTVSCEHYDEEGTINVTAVRDGSTLTGLKASD